MELLGPYSGSRHVRIMSPYLTIINPATLEVLHLGWVLNRFMILVSLATLEAPGPSFFPSPKDNVES